MSQPIVILIHIRRISRFLDSILSSKRVNLGRLSSERNYGSECRDLDSYTTSACRPSELRSQIPDGNTRTYRRLSIDMLLLEPIPPDRARDQESFQPGPLRVSLVDI